LYVNLGVNKSSSFLSHFCVNLHEMISSYFFLFCSSVVCFLKVFYPSKHASTVIKT
jgi:hypothetical protein